MLSRSSTFVRQGALLHFGPSRPVNIEHFRYSCIRLIFFLLLLLIELIENFYCFLLFCVHSPGGATIFWRFWLFLIVFLVVLKMSVRVASRCHPVQNQNMNVNVSKLKQCHLQMIAITTKSAFCALRGLHEISIKLTHFIYKIQGCGLGLDVSVSRRSRDVSTSRLGLISTKMPNVSVSSRSRTSASRVSSRSRPKTSWVSWRSRGGSRPFRLVETFHAGAPNLTTLFSNKN